MDFNNNCNYGGSCPKGGVKIRESNNDYKKDPFMSAPVDKDNVKLLAEKTSFNFKISDYSLDDLFRLFKLENKNLTDEKMKEARKFLLKLHPDKSGLDPQYFIFYSKAFESIQNIYEYQNKSQNKKINMNEYAKNDEEFNQKYHSGERSIIKNLYEKNESLKEGKNFNNWFNEQFEKYGKETVSMDDYGYENWMKSDEGLVNDKFEGLNAKNLNATFETHKKKVMQVVVYDEINSYNSGSGYSDLRQAYNESIIPVNEDLFNQRKKYNDVNEYINDRDRQEITPLDKKVANEMLMNKEERDGEMSRMMAYQYAIQTEKSKQNTDKFWSNLKTLGY